jgi:hypothetical protein
MSQKIPFCLFFIIDKFILLDRMIFFPYLCISFLERLLPSISIITSCCMISLPLLIDFGVAKVENFSILTFQTLFNEIIKEYYATNETRSCKH